MESVRAAPDMLSADDLASIKKALFRAFMANCGSLTVKELEDETGVPAQLISHSQKAGLIPFAEETYRMTCKLPEGSTLHKDWLTERALMLTRHALRERIEWLNQEVNRV